MNTLMGKVEDKLEKIMKYLMILGVVALIIYSVRPVSATPSGPSSITTVSSGRSGLSGGQQVSAQAGNVSELNINGRSITNNWQGFFGNVSGAIVLGDANNNTFYNWNSASPQGEVYATRTASTPTWTSIRCANITNIGSEDTTLQANESSDADSVNNTFLNSTSFTQFYVGNVNINTSQNCFAAHMYNSSAQPSSSSFGEVLLHDGSNLVYTTLLSPKTTGFDNRSHDFEMLVGENGHNGDTALTTYYFYVELG